MALSVARVVDQRRPQADRRHVFDPGVGHAAARLFRCDHDALAAGNRDRRRSGVPAARSLRPDLFLARHDHDLSRGDAVRRGTYELCRSAAARCARRRLSCAQLGQLLADGIGRAADQRVSRDRQFRPHRLDGLSAAVWTRLLARRGRRLLPLALADLGHRHVVRRHQHGHHDPQIARPGDDLFPHAGILLECLDLEHIDCCRLSDPDRDLRDAAARSLRRHALFHQ